jgi:hypothetical protein
MPEVAIYEGAPNAFATGAFKNSALVAVSTGLLQSMNKEEVHAVLGHEIAHVANGDMVTLTLIQGVVNTFVFFLARVIGTIVDKAVFRSERGTGPGYFITVIVAQIVLGIFASMIVAWFSRHREFRADAGSAKYLGTPSPMVECAAAAGRARARRAAEGDERVRHHRQGRHHVAPRDAPADRGAHRGAQQPRLTHNRDLHDDRALRGTVVQRPARRHRPRGMRLPYRVHKLELMKGEQRTPEFLKINPAGAIPVIVDPDGPGGKPITLSQSGAIAIYAAEKTGKFLPQDPARRALALQWLMYAVTDCTAASMSVFFETVLLPEKKPENLKFCEERLCATSAWPMGGWRAVNGWRTTFRSPTSRCIRSAPCASPTSTAPATCRICRAGWRRSPPARP